MSAYKIVQKIPNLTIASAGGITTSNPIALRSGYLRITPDDDAYIEISYNPGVTTSSIFVNAGSEIILKETPLSQPIVGVSTGATTTLTVPSGTHCAFRSGDFIEITGLSPVGLNTTFVQVTSVNNDSSYNSDHGTTMVINLNTSAVASVTDSNGEARKTIRVAALNAGTGANTIHITEVQVVSNFG